MGEGEKKKGGEQKEKSSFVSPCLALSFHGIIKVFKGGTCWRMGRGEAKMRLGWRGHGPHTGENPHFETRPTYTLAS